MALCCYEMVELLDTVGLIDNCEMPIFAVLVQGSLFLVRRFETKNEERGTANDLREGHFARVYQD